MINEFIDFCADVFPSISPYKIENLKKSIEQFKLDGKTYEYYLSNPLEYLAQGDVFNELPFTYFKPDGSQIIIKRKAMLLSNTCDASRRTNLIFAALQPIKDFDDGTTKILDIKNNQKTQLMYIPCSKTIDEAVDFGLINTYSREAINSMINSKKLNKLYSLNDYGYYILLTKITIFFCRRQDKDTENLRQYKLSL